MPPPPTRRNLSTTLACTHGTKESAAPTRSGAASLANLTFASRSIRLTLASPARRCTTHRTLIRRPRNLRTLLDHLPTLPPSLTLRQVRELSRARSLQVGAGLWGLAIAVQKRCVYMFGQVVCPWWIVGIVISLLQWAFYVDQKASLIANARELYKKKACS